MSQDTFHKHPTEQEMLPEDLEAGQHPLYLTPGEAEQLKLLVKIKILLERILQVMERPSLEMANKLHTLSMFRKEDEPDES